ncbi:hypothetical protein CS8_090840 [Cupriavidus sp. 8B]
MRIDDNLEVSESGAVSCSHCGTALGDCADEPLKNAIRSEFPSTAAGASVRAEPARFTERPIVLRRTFCPGCLVLLETEIVPQDEMSYRTWTLNT